MNGLEIIDKGLRVLALWVPVLLLIGIAKARQPKKLLAWVRGRRGAPILLDPVTYRQIHFVTVPTPSGEAAIEHVFVSRFGVFGVQVVTTSGWISGQIAEPEWTRQHYRMQSRLANPMHQSIATGIALAAALDIPADRVHPVIAFVGDVVFKTEMPVNVTRGIGFAEYIRSFETPVFSQDEVDALVERLRAPRTLSDADGTGETLSDPPADERAEPCGQSAPDASDRCPHCGLPLAAHPEVTLAERNPEAADGPLGGADGAGKGRCSRRGPR